jgi:ribosome recycling factor
MEMTLFDVFYVSAVYTAIVMIALSVNGINDLVNLATEYRHATDEYRQAKERLRVCKAELENLKNL